MYKYYNRNYYAQELHFFSKNLVMFEGQGRYMPNNEKIMSKIEPEKI
jgi:hypothetical protein